MKNNFSCLESNPVISGFLSQCLIKMCCSSQERRRRLVNINNSWLLLVPSRLVTIALFVSQVFWGDFLNSYYWTVLIGQTVLRIAAEFPASDCPGGNDLGFGHLRLKRRPGHSLLDFRVLRGLQAEFFRSTEGSSVNGSWSKRRKEKREYKSVAVVNFLKRKP